jgi:L-threonylcarbamoyladenylate synthase
MNGEVNAAYEVLKQGGVILYPTDTVWGLGCDATNAAAVNKVFEIKNRPSDKSMILLVDSDQMLLRYVRKIPDLAWDIMEMSEKPTTIIYDHPGNLPEEVISKDNTIAIRLTKDPFCVALIRKLKKPLVSTSANISGVATPALFNEISEKIKKSVNHIVNLRQDEKKKNQPSSIIRLKNNGEISIIRA